MADDRSLDETEAGVGGYEAPAVTSLGPASELTSAEGSSLVGDEPT
jgi:hypothetical protein